MSKGYLKFAIAGLATSLVASFGLPLAAHAEISRAQTLCEALRQDAPAGMRIAEAVWRKTGEKAETPGAMGAPSPSLPAHCDITGVLAERTGVDGQAYAIRFHLRLPEHWNKRFYFQGGGGTDGDLGDAIGRMGDTSALAQGYAVESQDSGHDNARNTRPDHNGASAFGFDPEGRLNYGRASLKASAEAARRLIVRYYGLKPRYAYFVGCSKGGQEGMAFAQYYPDMFDGIIAAAPGFALPRAALAEAWDTQVFGRLVTPPGQAFNAMNLYKAFSSGDMALVRKAVLEACDKDDGLEDGMVADTAACTTAKVEPQLRAKICTGEKAEGCLSAAQVKALILSHNGPKTSAGRSLYAAWPWSAGVSAEDWRIWKIGSSNGQVPPLNVILGGGALAGIFTTPPTAMPADPMTLGRYLWSFDFDRDAALIYTTGGAFRTSAWSDISAHSANLSAFKARGGKLIVPQGASDPVFSLEDTVAWYDEVDQRNGGRAADFVRVFPVPDMGHCSGGVATDQYDAFSALTAWVEHGIKPDEIIATAGPATPWPGRTRPLCPWPKVARYQGGDPEKAASFACRA
ncbi:MAG: tannase/feruloyl esterase family alpha/beta hydrolase [Asticcacaulis sp.]|uniref:tannase/feruloyl esterase family alpha/beta hydrolase n=1 Tax=Asticcacaulis sp. TaxID=1872648 RepID=UPI003F7BE9E8